MRAATVLIVAIAGFAQTSLDPAAMLVRARDKLLDRGDRVENYLCVETVNRSYLNIPKYPNRPDSCDRIMSDKKTGKYKMQLEATDRLRIDVKISEGREIGAWVGARKFDSRDLFELVGGGPFGTGPLGGIIGDIFANRAAHFFFEGHEELDGSTVVKYNYQVPVEFSHYVVQTTNGWVATAYHGEFWIDPESFELRHLTAKTSELPLATQTCVADNDVVYARQMIGARDFLLPTSSQLHFVMRDGTESHILTTYSNCRVYHAESTLHFEETAASDMPDRVQTASAARALPSRLRVRLALTSSIDTETAAAGDHFTAKVVDAVRAEDSKQIVVPAGAVVRGRIVGMEHVFRPRAYFKVMLYPQSIEINGVELRFYATCDVAEDFVMARRVARLSGRGVPVLLPPQGTPPTVATFYFESNKHFVVPGSFRSTWVTTLPPPQEDPGSPAH